MKGTEHFKRTIQMYLEQRAAEDTLFARNYRNPAKNIDDCVTYILNYVQRSGCNGFTDGEIFGQAVHYYDGANGMVQAVNELCGVHIAHYAEVNFDGLAGITDALGGVTVNVEQYMRDTENFSDVVELYPGVQKLNGAQALFFTRVRYAFADSDYTRMRHQRTFIKAMIAQILNTGDPVAIANTVNSTASMVITDLSVSDIISLGTQMIGMNTDKDIYTAYVPSEGTEIDGQSYVIADEDALAKMMKVIDAGDDPSSLNGQTDAEANAEAAEKSSEESSESSNSSSRQ